jgi:tRNA threonylcarbamoyladenosine biosynthesis protein TsaB
VTTIALDTTTDRATLAVERAGAPPTERMLTGARRHAAELLGMIEGALGDTGSTLDDVTRIALSDGPGGFTGLRVAAALIKGIVRTRPGIEVWTASTLLVRGAGIAPGLGARVLVVTSALRGELFAASYRLSLPEAVETITPPGLATVESLHREAPDVVVADAPERLVDRLAAQFSVPVLRGTPSLPRAAALLSLIGVRGGAVRIEQLDDWEPFYGRPAEAQARWEASHGRALPHPVRAH